MEWLTDQMRARSEPAVQMLVMRELDTPRATHVFERGSFLKPGEPVAPGVPEVLDAIAPPTAGNRLALARWLVDSRHPLSARVEVNRMWAQYFGTGLVETLDDFGAQADTCTHPALLDYLATELVRGGWHRKRLHRMIVLSATYRQASAARPETLERDPENRWLARAVAIAIAGRAGARQCPGSGRRAQHGVGRPQRIG